MTPLRHFVVRDNSSQSSPSLTPTMLNLLIALVVLLFAGMVLIAGLFMIRHVRKSRKYNQEDALPLYNEKPSKTSNHRRLTIQAGGPRAESIYVIQEKQNLIANSASPPPSPIPEIRITFPDEVDNAGKRQSGRVVVVRVGETSVGLEPLQDNLPPYQKSDGERFQSLDLERMGGLKEKEFS